MSSRIIGTLLSVLLPSSSPTRGFRPAFLQIQPSVKGYSDSPRPSSIPRLHLSEGASTKFLRKKVEPEYAKAPGTQGDVVFRIIIGKDGRVEEIHLLRGKPAYVEVAAKALSNWQYKPYIFNGNAVTFETIATVRFRPPAAH
jgi:outer membrane biosynthesis protein TonB